MYLKPFQDIHLFYGIYTNSFPATEKVYKYKLITKKHPHPPNTQTHTKFFYFLQKTYMYFMILKHTTTIESFILHEVKQ